MIRNSTFLWTIIKSSFTLKLKVMEVITSLAQCIAEFLLKNEAIDGKKLDIYIYGFEVLISGLINILIGLFIGLLFSQVVECSIFLFVFITLRKYCGGYHADTYLKCNLIFTWNLVCVMIILEFPFIIPLYIFVIICILSLIAFTLYSPIESIYKPITKEAKKVHKITSLIIGIVFTIISIILYDMNYNYCVAINTALLSVTIAMIIEKFKGRM